MRQPKQFLQAKSKVKAPEKCSAKMIATYYEDQFCQKIHSFQNLEAWDDECEANKAYRGYNTWACSGAGVLGTNYWDSKCEI